MFLQQKLPDVGTESLAHMYIYLYEILCTYMYLHKEIIKLRPKLHPRGTTPNNNKVQQSLPLLLRRSLLRGKFKVLQDTISDETSISNFLNAVAGS